MQAIQTRELELMGFRHIADDRGRCDAAWPVYHGTGAAATAVVYFEIEPGDHLGTHTDSAEEVLVVLEGEIEATVGDERARASAGSLVVVPALVPHDVTAVGDRRARVAGIFGASTITSVFDDGFVETEGGRVVGTPPAEAALEAAAA